MKQEIKDRIEKIRKGEVPEGYKETKFGIYPEDWDEVLFSEIFDFNGGLSASWDQLGEQGIAYLHYGDIHKSTKTFIDVEKELQNLPKLNIPLEDVPEKNLITHGSVVFVDASEDYEGVSKAITILNNKGIPFINGLHTIVGKKKNGRLGDGYSRYFLNEWGIKKQIMFYSQGVKVLGINKNNINKIVCFIPSQKEQDKIADILSTWDELIAIYEKYISELLRFEKELQRGMLFGDNRFKEFIKSRESRRTKYFNLPCDWGFVEIGNFANQISNKNKKNIPLNVLSCTKNAGLVDSLKYFKKRVFSDDISTYKIVGKNQFVYATNHIDEGSIGLQNLYDEALVSPMYTVFETSSKINNEFLFRLLKTSVYIFIYQINTSATVDRRGSLRWNEFRKIKIPLPKIEEQNKVVDFLRSIEDEIRFFREKVKALTSQKKGLMQLLLTGIVRVKT